MKQLPISVLAIVCLILLSGCSGHKDLSFEADYTIDADLFPQGQIMNYTEKAIITNTGTDSTRELYFHIYANMFKHLYKVEDGDIAVTSVVDGDGNTLAYTRLQEGVLYHVKLKHPLKSGEKTELTFSCEMLIPDLERKYGISPDGDIQLPSFTVQLAIYDESGWDTEPLQEEGDGRYAAVADYDLTIRVSEDYTLACNGTELSCETGDDVKTYRYYAEKRRDLVIIACKDYVCLERNVEDTTILGYFNKTVNCVTPDNMERVMDYAAFALDYFNSIFPEYPYDTLVVTNVALGSNVAVNMEYPGLITVYFDEGGASSGTRTGTYHEVAHQWFYGLIGNNENKEPWLDEGFATFATGLCLEAAGVENVTDTYWSIYAISDITMPEEKVNVAADEAKIYDFVIYNRGCMFLKHLMEAMGYDKFTSVLSDYCQKNMYKIATTNDFLNTLYNETDIDLSSIVDEYISEDF